MANRNFDKKQALEREVKDLYARFTAGSAGSPGEPAAEVLMHFDGTYDDEIGTHAVGVYNPSGVVFDPAGAWGSAISGDENQTFRVTLTTPLDIFFNPTEDFTIEAWYYPNIDPGMGGRGMFQLVSDAGASDNLLCVGRYNENIALILDNVSYVASGNELASNTWHHVALVRAGNQFTIYVDGVGIISQSAILAFGSIGTYEISLSDTSATFTGCFNGKIDEFRVTRGAIYTSNFPIPTQPFSPFSPPTPPSDPELLSDVGVKSVTLEDTGTYLVTLEDKYVSLKHAKAVLISDIPQDVKFTVLEDAIADDAYVVFQALDSNNVAIQPDEDSEILLKLELKNSSVEK